MRQLLTLKVQQVVQEQQAGQVAAAALKTLTLAAHLAGLELGEGVSLRGELAALPMTLTLREGARERVLRALRRMFEALAQAAEAARRRLLQMARADSRLVAMRQSQMVVAAEGKRVLAQEGCQQLSLAAGSAKAAVKGKE